MLINIQTYQVDRNWKHINIDKYPTHIKLIEIGSISTLIISKHIKLIEIGSISMLINIQTYQVDRYPRHIQLIEFGIVST
jgi:hypothetical protein